MILAASKTRRHLLDAIAGMHQLGYIHRDIKPANFAITPRFAAVHEGAHRFCHATAFSVMFVPTFPPLPLPRAKQAGM